MFSESNPANLLRFNNYCRTHDPVIGFISCEFWGAAGHGFVDFGDHFLSFDQDGENIGSFIVSHITVILAS